MVTTAGKGGYTAEVQNIYGVSPTTPPEENNAEIESLHASTQGIQDQIFDMDGLAQANTFLTSTNTTVMEQLAQLTRVMG